MSNRHSFLFLGLFPLLLATLSACNVEAPKDKEATAVIPFELRVILEGKEGQYCIGGLTQDGARRPEAYLDVDGMSFHGESPDPAPSSLSDLVNTVRYQDSSSIEVTDCEGRRISRSYAQVTVDFIEVQTHPGARPEVDLALIIEGQEIGEYALSIPLASRTRTMQAKAIREGSYPLSAVWVEAKLEVPLSKDEPEQLFSVNTARAIESR